MYYFNHIPKEFEPYGYAGLTIPSVTQAMNWWEFQCFVVDNSAIKFGQSVTLRVVDAGKLLARVLDFSARAFFHRIWN